MSHPSELDAVLAFVTALAVAAVLTPVTMRIARAVGAIDRPRARGLSDRSTPLLGGLAIFAGALVAGLVWLPAGYGGDAHLWQGVLLAAGVIALVGAGAALGFLLYNFPPASSFMGDCGANLLGLLMGCIAVEAAVKTAAVVSLVLPLILLAVPFLDTTFVVLKRLKYHQPIYRSDSEHFHHRMARIGFSSRRTIAYLYAWTLMLAGLALALRFVPYSDHKGHLHTGWTLVIIGLGVIAVAASVYLVYVLEILKFRHLDTVRLRRLRPDASPAEIERGVALDLETGEFRAVSPPDGRASAVRAEQRFGERQVDE